ncbi:hypothetical protein MIND_01156000 [Mycena indigotica]|uniref:RTA1-domain-containing protein n=1 Tax=Mycena indigotica TaxID=2126181 RepID=A0A8H6S771_9AGAR|nr:uncharacterized protein MIND_01156000 [Mycena indigotica]KAF7292585.1 hypothetical protein MIND_01156000 [Mycena indigotica]
MASQLMAFVLRDLQEPSNSTVPPNFPTITDAEAQYGYMPSEAIAILFIALFGISTILHAGQALYFRTWFLLPTAALCGIGEIIGWGGRLWSAISPNADTPFKMQISATIISPTPLLAASFIIFSRVIRQLGPGYSLLPARWYAWIFVTCDIVALLVQGVGGGIASAAATLDGANQGADIMLGGIAFQFAVVILFSILVCDFLLRYLRDTPWRESPKSSSTSLPTTMRGPLIPRTKIILSALAFSTVVLFIRSVYRLIELAGGWEGRIIHTQVYFNVLDGGMIVLAIFTWNFVHPGVFLAPPQAVLHFEEVKRTRSRETDSPANLHLAFPLHVSPRKYRSHPHLHTGDHYRPDYGILGLSVNRSSLVRAPKGLMTLFSDSSNEMPMIDDDTMYLRSPPVDALGRI